MSFADARRPTLPFAASVAGGATTATAMVVADTLTDGSSLIVSGAPVLLALVLFCAALIVARGDGIFIPKLIVETAPSGAVPGCVCGALWWWLHRRHVQEER